MAQLDVLMDNCSSKPVITTVLGKQAFCEDLSGRFDPAQETCTFERLSDGLQPSCFHATAQKVFADDMGACYDFQRLDNGTYRQRYRLNDACWAKLPAFQQLATDPQRGVCRDPNAWMGAAGQFLPVSHGQVTPKPNDDPRDCRTHTSQSKCEASLCGWSEMSTHVRCAPGTDCSRACFAMGGVVKANECVVPKCRPKAAMDTPCAP